MTSEQIDQAEPRPRQQAEPGQPVAWRQQARFLGGVLALAAAVIAVGLHFSPEATAYAGVSPSALAGLVALVLVLAGACVLFAASLTAPSSGRRGELQPPPGAPPWYPAAANPDPAAPSAATPAVNPAVDPVGNPAVTPAAAPPAPGRLLTILGSVLGAIGLALAALAVALTVLLPTPTERIMVQFTDLYGRVQLEYCPTLPASFPATASRADLVGSSTILPVKVSGDTCGDSEYTDGVWIYLNRTSITVSDQP